MVDAISGSRRQITKTTRGRVQSAMGAQRHPRHVDARGQPVHCPDRRERVGASDAADRRRAAPARAAADRQPALPARRGREAHRLCREAEGGKEEDRGRTEEEPAADLRAPGSTDGGRSDALARRHARLHRDSRARGRREADDRPELRHRDRPTPRTFRRGRTSATRRTAGCSVCSTSRPARACSPMAASRPPSRTRRARSRPTQRGRPRQRAGLPAGRIETSGGRCPPCPTTAST